MVVGIPLSRNPFQGGVGFSTESDLVVVTHAHPSQSLSGWGGVFNQRPI